MNMRERIARLYAGRALNKFGDADGVVWNGLCNHDREIAFRHADAVLEVMREPTEAQIDTGRDELTERGCNPVTGDAEAVWTAMVEAARQ